MRILVTGGDGMLGSQFAAEWQDREVHPFGRAELDVTDAVQVETRLRETRPDLVVHAAALVDVDRCEREPEEAFRVNALGTRNVAAAAARQGVRLVYISSTGVYGDYQSEPFTEADEPRPPTAYHRSKLEGEAHAGERVADALIVRTGWLFGGRPEHKKNFVFRRYEEARSRACLYADPAQRGNPTYVADLVRQIGRLVDGGARGVFNCVGRGCATRFDYVKAIVEAFGLPCEVLTAPPGVFRRAAPVSPNESAVNARLERLGLDAMPDWRVSLARYVELLKASPACRPPAPGGA